jgi:papain like protease
VVAVCVVQYDELPGAGRCGRHVEHDPRSRAYDVEPADRSQLRARSVLWRRWSPILDQGDISSCTGNALAGLLGSEPFSRNLTGAARFDEAFALDLYEQATTLDRIPGQYPPDDTGSTGLAVAKAAKQAGLIGGYGWAFTTAGLIHALQTGPVIVGVPWYAHFDHPDARGLVQIAGEIRGGHEFVIRGWQSRPGAEGLFLADNSWGTSWGNGGSFAFTTGTWAQLREQQADVTVPRR